MSDEHAGSHGPTGSQSFFTRTSSLAVIDQAVVTGTNFLTGVMIGRICSPEEFGLYSLALTLILLMKGVHRPLIIVPYTTFVQRLDEADKNHFAGTTLLFQGVISGLAVLIMGIAALGASVFSGGQPFARVLWALALFIAFMLLREYARGICFASFRFGAAFVIDSITALIQLALLTIVIHFDRLSAPVVISIIGAAAGVTSLSWLLRNREDFELPRPSRISQELNRCWNFGRWLLAGSLVFLLSVQVFPWFVMTFHGTAKVGTFAACTTIVFLLNPFLLALNNLLGPVTVRARRSGTPELMRIVVKVTLTLGVVLSLFCCVLVFTGEFFLELLYKERYVGNGNIVILLALGVLAQTLGAAPMFGLIALERPQLNLKASLWALACSLTLGLWLTITYGILGAAWAKLISSGLLSGLRWKIFIAENRLPKRS